MRRRWSSLVVMAGLATVAVAGLRGDGDRSTALADCVDNCANNKDRPKFCSSPSVGNDGQVRCKRICCAADAECGEAEETRTDGKVVRSPYCKNVKKCTWYNGARTHHDPYEPGNQCCTDYGVRAKFPIARLSECNEISNTSPKTKPTSNGCGPDDKPMDGKFKTGGKAVNFTPACNAHDVCFGTCGASRVDCNDAFEKALKKICTGKFKKGANRNTCLEQADIYTSAVRMFGGDAFEAAQVASCQCCP